MELRERRGLCYDVHSYASYFLDTGAFSVYTGVEPAHAEEALAVVLEQLIQARDGGVAADELARAKELAKGRLLLRMEDTRAVSDWMGAQELLTGRIRSVEEVTSSIDAVTEQDVQRIARQIILSQALNLAVVGRFRTDKRFASLLSL
jgi:predicted Zn-dependent peptidase